MTKAEIICLGEALIDITPRLPGNNIVDSGEMLMTASGAPAIVAAALAKLGSAAGFIGRVGDDFFGHHLKQTLDSLGVDTTALHFERQYNTGLAFVNWNEQGNAVYLFYRNPSADMLLQPADIDSAYLSNARVLQFGSLLLATEPSGEATRRAIHVAREAGLILSYDLNLRLGGWADQAAALAGVSFPLEFASIVKVNRVELDFLTGDADPESGTEKLWRDNFKLMVVTLDKYGCYFRTATASGYVPGFEVLPVDTVGAGDAFMAGLLDGLRRGNYNFNDAELVRQACRQGNAAGALMVTRQGAIPALPSREEVDRLLSGEK
ncbi:MAG TPA: PfkB family carbohydrate kinase [Chloroflexia bacterium]|nr:PfkB family carbohydrate kinase [Chloroflexia bacterium]